MRRTGTVLAITALFALVGCASAAEPEPTPTQSAAVELTVSPTPTPSATTTAEPSPDTESALDLSTDAALCAADAELSNLELNDAIAPLLGLPADGAMRTAAQDDAIRAYKNAAFERECPARAG